MSEFCMSVVQVARKYTDLLILLLNDAGRLCGDPIKSFRVPGVPVFPFFLLVALVAIPATTRAEPVVGAKFSIASGWAGISAASDGTNFLVGLESDTSTAKVAAQLISSSGAKIGSTIALGHDGQSCCASGVAFDGTNYLVAWEEDQGIKTGSEPYLVYGQFINMSGGQVGQAFAMTTAGIFFDSVNMLAYGGGRYLLTYTRLIVPSIGDQTRTNQYVAGRIVSPDGSMGSEFRISQGYGNGSSLAFDGTNFFVVWKSFSPDFQVRGRFVSPTGSLGQEISISARPDLNDKPTPIDFDGTNYLVAWTESVGSGSGVFGQLVSPSGALVGGMITGDGSGQGNKLLTGIGFDGSNHLLSWTDMKNDANGNKACDAGEGTCWDVYGRYAGKDGSLASSKFAINTDAGNQMGGITCAGGKCLALISSGVRLGDGMEQVGEVYGAFLTAQQMSPLALVAGWNLVGNSVDAAITVTTSFSDTNKVASVWKWVTSGTTSGVTYPTWAFYSPLQSDDGVAYARNEGYEFLTTINAGEGYWLNANAAFTAQLPSGTAIASTTFRGMSSGWHLIATGDTTTPSQFNSDLSVISPAAGETPRNVTSLWAWDSAQSKWYFYAPRLAAEGGSTLSNFITSNGYLNFTTASKTLGSGIGFWVNTP